MTHLIRRATSSSPQRMISQGRVEMRLTSAAHNPAVPLATRRSRDYNTALGTRDYNTDYNTAHGYRRSMRSASRLPTPDGRWLPSHGYSRFNLTGADGCCWLLCPIGDGLGGSASRCQFQIISSHACLHFLVGFHSGDRFGCLLSGSTSPIHSVDRNHGSTI